MSNFKLFSVEWDNDEIKGYKKSCRVVNGDLDDYTGVVSSTNESFGKLDEVYVHGINGYYLTDSNISEDEVYDKIKKAVKEDFESQINFYCSKLKELDKIV
jgi:hypothetical protein